MTTITKSCRDVRRRVMDALLSSPPRRELPAELADHVAACKSCARHWSSLLAATHLFEAAPAHTPWLRQRTLARVAGRSERAPASVWVWLAATTAVSLVATYVLPTCLLSQAFESLLGSPNASLTAALLVIGSLSVLLPASVAASLLRLRTAAGFLTDIEKEVFHD